MKRIEIIETIIIFLAIFSLWPAIFHREGPGGKMIMYIALALLIWVMINRIRRLRSLYKKVKGQRKER